MAIDIRQILDNIKQVSMSPSAMDTIQEFERVLDENGIYAFLNWKSLELVDGPLISAYRIRCTFSSPLEKMPDPSGAARLLSYGVKVQYEKGILNYPIKIKSEGDYRSAIKKAKMAKTPVWLITIDMPKYLIRDISQGSEEIMNDEIDMRDIDDAYEQDLNTHRGAQKAAAEQSDQNGEF